MKCAYGPVRALPLPLVQVTPPNEMRRAVITGEDPMKCHEFEIVLMRADAEMRNARERFRDGFAVGHVNLRGRVMQLHRSLPFDCRQAGRRDGLANPLAFFIGHMH